MKLLEKICNDLGSSYSIKKIDLEDVLYRKLENGYEFEISGIKSTTGKCTLYVHSPKPHVVVGIYEELPVPQLKDLLGYYSSKYQNLSSGIRVLRED